MLSLSGAITPFLKTDLHHIPCSLNSIDAVFIVKNVRNDPTYFIQDQFENNHITVSNNDIYTSHSLSEQAILKYCSQNVSLEVLAQVMNHASIYKYALNNNLSSILIVEARSTLKGNIKEIEKALKELKNTATKWDVLFLNIDYCSGKNGEMHIAPQVMENGKMKQNKRVISSRLSKVFCRYGFSCYVISDQGMKKMLHFLDQNWPNLPLDQIVFHVPSLECYSVNKDILINGIYTNSKENSSKKLTFYGQRDCYPLKSEFWIDPIKLLHTERLDIIVKYLYAKSLIENKEIEINKKYYLEHIKGWNNFYEGAPLKIGTNAFLNSFQQLIHSLQVHGYKNSEEPVPINSSGSVLNGSHRVGACMALHIPIKVKVIEKSSNAIRKCFAQHMRKEHQVSKEAIDYFVTQYVLLKPNTYAIKCFQAKDNLFDLISCYVDVIDYHESEGLYIIESEDAIMIEKVIKALESKDVEPLLLSHQEMQSILCP